MYISLMKIIPNQLQKNLINSEYVNNRHANKQLVNSEWSLY